MLHRLIINMDHIHETSSLYPHHHNAAMMGDHMLDQIKRGGVLGDGTMGHHMQDATLVRPRHGCTYPNWMDPFLDRQCHRRRRRNHVHQHVYQFHHHCQLDSVNNPINLLHFSSLQKSYITKLITF